MKHYVLCLVDTDDEAQEITRRVINAGFGKEEIFVLSSDRKDLTNSAERRNEEPGLFQEGVGLLAASGSTMIGGTGSFVGAGKMMDAASRGERRGISLRSWPFGGRRTRVPEEAVGRRESRCGANRRPKVGGGRSDDLRRSSR
jgi:hypothetical protein